MPDPASSSSMNSLHRLERTLDLRRQQGAPEPVRTASRSMRCEVCDDAMAEVGGMCRACRARMLAGLTGDGQSAKPASTRRPQGLLERVPGTLYRCSPDQQRRCSFVTDAIADLTGFPADEFRAGRQTLGRIVHPDDQETVRQALTADDLVKGFELEYRILTASGQVRWVSDRGRRSGRSAPFWDEGLLVDVTEKRNSYEQLLHESRTDPLTGTANRRALTDRLNEECVRAQRTGVPLCVLALDADHFKKVNDTYGHDVGDRVLVDLATRFAQTVRPYDLVARVGGEEFVVVLLGASRSDAAVLAERVRAAVEGQPCGGVPVTVSVGCTDWRTGDTPDGLVKRADEALYRAKNGGRNQVVVIGDEAVTG